MKNLKFKLKIYRNSKSKMSDHMEIEIQREYTIAIKVQEWNELECRAETEEFKDSNNQMQIRAKKLKGTWVKPFEDAINGFENQEYKILGMNFFKKLNLIYFSIVE